MDAFFYVWSVLRYVVSGAAFTATVHLFTVVRSGRSFSPKMENQTSNTQLIFGLCVRLFNFMSAVLHSASLLSYSCTFSLITPPLYSLSHSNSHTHPQVQTHSRGAKVNTHSEICIHRWWLMWKPNENYTDTHTDRGGFAVPRVKKSTKLQWLIFALILNRAPSCCFCFLGPRCLL